MSEVRLPPSPSAVNHWISDRSVALLLTPQEGGLYIGSAAAIELCGSYFLATAAHNLEGISTREQVRALPGGRRLDRPLYILEWNSLSHVASGELDVAWLEVETISAGASSISFITAASLLCGATHQESTVFPVHGFPEACIDRGDVFEGMPLLCGTSVFSFSIPPSASALAFQDHVDLLLEWPPSDLRDSEVEVPHPSGVSGGGVWLLPGYIENPTWTHRDLRLVALNRAWRRESRQLVTTRIEHWLKLLRQDKPYTQREIDPLLDAIET
jgi:hypothetical protein